MNKYPENRSQQWYSINEIQDWFHSDVGQQLLEAEQRAINRLIPKLFGFHLVELTVNPKMDLSAESLIGHRIVVSQEHMLGLSNNTLLCHPTELPFEHNSVDVVLLHHSLDFTENPHQVLREATRILRPGGHLLVLGFNPASWWGLRRLCARNKKVPWLNAQFLSHRRLNDWMSLLGLTELRVMTDFYLPPFVSNTWRKRFEKVQAWGRRSMPKNGAFTVTLARKDIEGVTPVKRIVFPRKLIRLPVRKAATRDQVSETR